MLNFCFCLLTKDVYGTPKMKLHTKMVPLLTNNIKYKCHVTFHILNPGKILAGDVTVIGSIENSEENIICMSHVVTIAIYQEFQI